MKAQSTKASIIEAWGNVAVGMGLNFILQLLTFNHFAFHYTYWENLQITVIFTVASLIRSFVLRRVFNWFTERSLSVKPDVFLMTGEALPVEQCDAINKYCLKYGYEKQADGIWRHDPSKESYLQFCRRKK